MLTRTALRCALACDGDANAGGGADEREASELLRRVCTAARGRGMRAEQLVITLKVTWQSLSEKGRLRRERQEAILDRVISRSIKEYYG